MEPAIHGLQCIAGIYYTTAASSHDEIEWMASQIRDLAVYVILLLLLCKG